MSNSESGSNPALRTWPWAIGVAFLGSCTLWWAGLGVNWPLWVTAATAGAWIASRYRLGRLSRPALWAGIWAIVLSTGVVFATGTIAGFAVVISLIMLAQLAVHASEIPLTAVRTLTMMTAPLFALGRALIGTIVEITALPGITGSQRGKAVLRGVCLAAPLLVVLVAVLGDADPIFGDIRDAVSQWFPNIISAHTLFFFFLLAVTLGTYSAIAREQKAIDVRLPAAIRSRLSLGRTERTIVIVTVTTIVWLFVVSAVTTWFANPAGTAGTGVTYAEYARRGFGEVALAVTIVIGTIFAIDRCAANGNDERSRLEHRTMWGAVGALAIMLVIAFARVIAYEQMYGYTMSRVYAQLYMCFLGCAILLMGLELLAGRPSGRYTFRLANVALATFAVALYWNTDAWVLNKNIDLAHAATTSTNSPRAFDADYLWQLEQYHIIPTIIRRFDTLDVTTRSHAQHWLACRAASQNDVDSRWFAYNVRVRQSTRQLRTFITTHGVFPSRADCQFTTAANTAVPASATTQR